MALEEGWLAGMGLKSAHRTKLLQLISERNQPVAERLKGAPFFLSSLLQPTTSHHRRRTTAYRPLFLKASEIETFECKCGCCTGPNINIFILVDIVDWNVEHG
jgi:hypothetical protein